jgi:ubiquinone/menaquinone biosynthesis C-methylase UbiE
MSYRSGDRMFDAGFKIMTVLYKARDFFLPTIERRIQTFGIQPGMTVVDYACGPGRYTIHYARLVGPTGRVFAVDIHELAIAAVQKKIERYHPENVTPILAQGYSCGLPDHIAHLVTALDMFFFVQDPTALLAELRRITRPEGILVLDDGHQSRETTHRKLTAAASWEVVEESKDHLVCKPLL